MLGKQNRLIFNILQSIFLCLKLVYIISYDVLDVPEFKHYKINHSEKFSEEKNHINSIENFVIKPKNILVNLMEYKKNIFTYLLKNVNLYLIIQKLKNSWKLYIICKKGAFLVIQNSPKIYNINYILINVLYVL